MKSGQRILDFRFLILDHAFQPREYAANPKSKIPRLDLHERRGGQHPKLPRLLV